MLLVADSGSTKTDWVLVRDGAQEKYSTIGYNPFFVSSEGMYRSLMGELSHRLDAACIKNVFFYGAGCSTEENNAIVRRALAMLFVNATISVEHDLLAAARALLKDQRGFAAIIGTGSNTCIYNGKDVEHNIDSLGYLLGDEGSGSYIGKKIVRDYMRGYLPAELNDKFSNYFKLTPAEIYHKLYDQPNPNRFLASFCRFATEQKDNAYIREVVNQCFIDFFSQQVSRYPMYRHYTFNCVGSVGHIFKEELQGVAGKFNMELGNIMAAPIEELVKYHQDRI
jgi:N-acetylglucosamine kinase-like BadF-type ATPase